MTPTKRTLETRISELEGDSDPAELPTMGFSTWFALADEDRDIGAYWVDREQRIISVHGENHYLPEFAAFFEADEDDGTDAQTSARGAAHA